MSALVEEELSLDARLSKLGSHRSTWEEIAALDLLHLPSPSSAIFTASDGIVPGVVSAQRR